MVDCCEQCLVGPLTLLWVVGCLAEQWLVDPLALLWLIYFPVPSDEGGPFGVQANLAVEMDYF